MPSTNSESGIPEIALPATVLLNRVFATQSAASRKEVNAAQQTFMIPAMTRAVTLVWYAVTWFARDEVGRRLIPMWAAKTRNGCADGLFLLALPLPTETVAARCESNADCDTASGAKCNGVQCDRTNGCSSDMECQSALKTGSESPSASSVQPLSNANLCLRSGRPSCCV